MDIDELELWKSKIEQKRQIRADDYRRCLIELQAKGIVTSGDTPIQLYQVATQNLGDLNIMWRDILQGSWQRPSRDPNKAAVKDKNDINDIIQNEQDLVHTEIANILRKNGINPTKDILHSGKEILQTSSNVLKNRCFVMIENLRQNRTHDRKQRRKELLIPLLSGAIIAIFTV